MLRFNKCFLVLLMGLPIVGWAQDDTDEDRHEKVMERIVPLVQKEIFGVYRNRIQIQSLHYQDYFQLEDHQIQQLDKVADEIAAELAEGHTDVQIENILTRKIRKTKDLEFFSINGVLYSVFPSDDTEGEKAQVNLQVSTAGDHLWLNADTGGSSMNSPKAIDLISDKRWRKAIGDVDDEELKAFHANEQERRRGQLLKFMEVMLADELMLTDGQYEPIRQWLAGHTDLSIPPKDNAVYSQVRKTVSELKDQLPDCVTEVQKSAYLELKRRMQNR